MNKIAFIITTFERDELLFKSIESLSPFMQKNWNIIIVDQGKLNTEKENWLNDKEFDSLNHSRHNNPQKLFYYQVPFDSGLSYCRNYGVQKAKELGCEYVFIGSDSFIFKNDIVNLNDWIKSDLYGFDILGTDLVPSKCGWEAKLNLIEGQCFELNFVDKSLPHYLGSKIPLWDVDIMRNCFIAKTNVLLETTWDEKFKLGEHEDEFYRLKLNNVKCGWTNDIVLEKQIDRPTEYTKLRKINFNNGIKYLREKWNIKSWVAYKNLERAKKSQLKDQKGIK